MPRTVNYHLHSIQASSLPGAATIQVVQPGRIVGITIMVAATGGAAAGFYNLSVDLNNQGQLFQSINNPPREIILSSLLLVTPITTSVGIILPHTPLSIPLRVGDILSLNIAQTGTAATTITTNANVCVMENGG